MVEIYGADGLKTGRTWASNLSGATLRNADLRGARLLGARVSHTVFDGANLSSADLRGCEEKDLDLSRAGTQGTLRGPITDAALHESRPMA